MSVAKPRQTQSRAAHLGPERRRPQFLDMALKLVAEQGLHSVNMESVAQAASVTKPSLYACFASREDLLNALLQREEQRLLEAVLSALPAKLDLSDPEQFVTEGFRALFQVVERHGDSWRLVLAAGSDPVVGERHRAARQLVARRASLLAQGWMKRRRVKDIPRRLPVLVELFMATCEGMVRAILDGSFSHWTTDELAAYVGRLMLSAIEKA